VGNAVAHGIDAVSHLRVSATPVERSETTNHDAASTPSNISTR
jgi:hypothetical protein